MTQKKYLLLKSWLYIISALFFLCLPLWANIGENGLGLPFSFFMAALFTFLAYHNFKKIKNTRDQEMAYAPPIDATINQQIKFYKTYLIIGIIGFILLALITIPDLNDLQSKNIERAHLWAPIAILYNHFGYWTAVCSLPISCMVITLLFLRKIYYLQKSDNK